MMQDVYMSQQAPQIKKLRILIVEDDGPTRTAISRLIKQVGGDVTTARDGEEGLGFLVTQHFDVLLTDLRMPVMDGIEMLQHVMRLPDHRRPGRIIAISGEYDRGVLRGAPVGFMQKPFNIDTLLDMLSGKPN
jgi:CheY-like chemotaxis protein